MRIKEANVWEMTSTSSWKRDAPWWREGKLFLEREANCFFYPAVSLAEESFKEALEVNVLSTKGIKLHTRKFIVLNIIKMLHLCINNFICTLEGQELKGEFKFMDRKFRL